MVFLFNYSDATLNIGKAASVVDFLEKLQTQGTGEEDENKGKPSNTELILKSSINVMNVGLLALIANAAFDFLFDWLSSRQQNRKR